MFVIKRGGKIEKFSFSKISNAVENAYESCGKKMPLKLISDIKAMFKNMDSDTGDIKIDVEEIRDIVEEKLVKDAPYDVSKSFIIERYKNAEENAIKERVRYMKNYQTNGQNAATSSATDPNANMNLKNVANMGAEVYKPDNRKTQRIMLYDSIKDLYSEKLAKQYLKDLTGHLIYSHDEASTPVLMNYTYSPSEVAHFRYNDVDILTSLKSMYDIAIEPEVKQIGNEVWSKFPTNLYVQDNNGFTKVTRLTRKGRYNDMVRVKTAFGEDLVVTANHPLIKSEDKEDRVNAIDSLGEKQKRLGENLKFKGLDKIDLAGCVDTDEVHEKYILTHETQAPYFYTKRYVNLDRDFGYVVGFFVGDGNYDNTFDNIMFSQKDKNILENLANKLFTSLGIVSYTHQNDNGVYVMKVCSRIVNDLFRSYFKIKDKAQNKCLPYNLLEFNEDFAKGIIEGIIDSDGNIQNNNSSICIRLSSRECIMQLTMLLKHFGYGVSNTHQSTPFGNNTRIKSNYDIWGVYFSNSENVVKFDGSFKWKNQITKETVKGLKYSDGWSQITSVDKIEEGSYLDSCRFIYDITTETHTFNCNNLWVHNCEAVSLYPILNGTASLDGTGTEAPKNLQSFCGQLINATFLLAGQCKGACLYKDQKLIVEINGIRQTIKAKDLVEKYLNNIKKFTNYQGTWEYSDVNDVKIFEDGVFVPLKKVYRRKYDNKIYKITSHTGKIAFTSKDHIFKAFRAGQACEVKAEELRKFETVFINREIPFDINSVDYKKGWIKGMLLGDGCLTQPDMVQLSVNYEQIYYGNIFNQYSKEIYNDELHQNKGHKCYQYETHKKDFSALLKEDINGSNAFDKNVDLTNKSIDYKIGLLDGILCSDGRYSNNLSIELVNKGVIDSIIYILQELGLNYKYRVMPSHDNKHELYSLSIPIKILDYTPNLRLKINDKERKDTYYHSGYAKKQGTRNPEYIETNKKEHFLYANIKTDVIEKIEQFDNDDEYVYEVETETHWYNCGGFITHNCAFGEFFNFFDHFCVLDFGEDYDLNENKMADSKFVVHPKTIGQRIEQMFQYVVYNWNQPAGNRGNQSPFTNISYYDENYWKALFDTFRFPDGSQPLWRRVDYLQRKFMKWFNAERSKVLLTFPVETMALLTDGHDVIDKNYKELNAEMYAEGHSFFTYLSDNPDSLASCCRLRNQITENVFSFTNGLTGVQTGSCNVITLNLNRMIQNWFKENYSNQGETTFENRLEIIKTSEAQDSLKNYLSDIIRRMHKYHIAYKTMLYDWEKNGMFTASKAGYISMRKLYSTIGLNGVNEAAEFMGLKCTYNEDYKKFCHLITKTISDLNKEEGTKKFMFNTEFVPAESLSSKNYKWDKADNYWVPSNRNLYNSYFYIASDPNTTILDRFKLHGREFTGTLDGGVGLHCNLSENLSKEQYLKLTDFAIKTGCSYYTYNVPQCQCDKCKHIEKHHFDKCPVCGGTDVTDWTRVIGYLRPVKKFDSERFKEAKTRIYKGGQGDSHVYDFQK